MNKTALILIIQVVGQLVIHLLFMNHEQTRFGALTLYILLVFLGGCIAGIAHWNNRTVRSQWFIGALLSFVVGFGMCALTV